MTTQANINTSSETKSAAHSRHGKFGAEGHSTHFHRSGSLTPKRSLEQRMSALQHANEIRTARANLKKELRSGQTSILDLLQSPPEYILTAKLFDLLLAVPKYGQVKAYRILNRSRISPTKTIGGLSERQRKEIIALIGQ